MVPRGILSFSWLGDSWLCIFLTNLCLILDTIFIFLLKSDYYKIFPILAVKFKNNILPMPRINDNEQRKRKNRF